MKKLFYFTVAAMLICLSATANQKITQTFAGNKVEEIASSWEDVGEVSVKFFGTNVKGTAQGRHRVQYDSETGKYRINFKGSWYYAKPSDRSGFNCMFYADRAYYFNI